MKTIEIEIPPQYADIIAHAAAEHGISADELVENAIRKLLERSMDDAGN